MTENLDPNLLCAESTLTCSDDTAIDDIGVSMPWHYQTYQTLDKDPIFHNTRSNSSMGFPLQCQEIIGEMLEREREHLPRDDYLKRFRSGDLDLSFRREAIDWIWKACDHFNFGPLCICLSTNYLDRFLSVHELPKGKAWAVQLLAVACLSLAAKMEETQVPQSMDLQVGEPNFVFEAKTIQRMEILVLNKLKWRLQVLTPSSFVDYFFGKINGDQDPSSTLISRALQIIVSTTKGIDFLEFKASEIAAAVAISVSEEVQAVHLDNAISCFTHVEKERVMKCVEMMKDSSFIGGSDSAAASSSSVAPKSPNGVLDAAVCLSYKNDDLTSHGSSADSSYSSSPLENIKRRRKQEPALDN